MSEASIERNVHRFRWQPWRRRSMSTRCPAADTRSPSSMSSMHGRVNPSSNPPTERNTSERMPPKPAQNDRARATGRSMHVRVREILVLREEVRAARVIVVRAEHSCHRRIASQTHAPSHAAPRDGTTTSASMKISTSLRLCGRGLVSRRRRAARPCDLNDARAVPPCDALAFPGRAIGGDDELGARRQMATATKDIGSS